MLNNFIKIILFFIFLYFIPVSFSMAKIKTLSLSLNDKLLAPRWETGEAMISGIKGNAKILAEIKEDLIKGKYVNCLEKVKQHKKTMLSLNPWLAYIALKCARNNFQSQKNGFESLSYWIEEVNNNKSWWLFGGHKDLLISEYLTAQIEAFNYHIRGDRNLAWSVFDIIMQYKELLTKDQMAYVLKKAGELSFLQQRLVAAFDYLTRSLRLKSDNEVSNRLKSIKEILIERKLIPPVEPVDVKTINILLEASERENKINDQMKVALAAGDLVSAIEDGVRLITEYPSGQRSEEAEKKLLQIFINVLDKKGSKYQPLQERMFQQLKKINGRKLYQWSKYLFNKGLHNEANKVFSVTVDKLEGDTYLSEILSLWGQSLVYISNYNEAIDAFQKSILIGAGTEYAERSLFLLGLTYFQMGKMSEAAAQFERLLAARQNSDYEVRSYYWLWRSIQSIDGVRATEIGKTLFTKFPLTYYGLRARFEIEGESLDWLKVKGVEDLSFNLNLSDIEYLAWQKANLLMEAGWFEEAQEELKILPPAYLPTSKFLMARIWSMAFDHQQAISLINQAWDMDSSLLNMFSLKMAFPNEYRVYVEKYAKLNSLENEIVWALIRQESSFKNKATSPAGAMGLMQLMTPTAQEVSNRIRISPLKIPEDVYDPENNIRMGASYLAQMIRAFDGHLPFALAAYNVGIGNMRRWMRLRDSLEKGSLSKSSNFRNEIWIDELPWSETSHYVKAALRNLIIYRMIASQKLSLKEPIW